MGADVGLPQPALWTLTSRTNFQTCPRISRRVWSVETQGHDPEWNCLTSLWSINSHQWKLGNLLVENLNLREKKICLIPRGSRCSLRKRRSWVQETKRKSESRALLQELSPTLVQSLRHKTLVFPKNLRSNPTNMLIPVTKLFSLRNQIYLLVSKPPNSK